MNLDGDKLDPFDVDEQDDLTCRFARALRTGETIVSATVDVGVHAGTDATPAAIKVGEHQVVGTDVIQRIKGHLALGVDEEVVYWMRCVGTFNSGRTCTIAGRFRILRMQ